MERQLILQSGWTRIQDFRDTIINIYVLCKLTDQTKQNVNEIEFNHITTILFLYQSNIPQIKYQK